MGNCNLLQILVCELACVICIWVQCELASLTVPKGRSGWAKTKFFLSVSLWIVCVFSCFNQFYLLVQFLFSLAGNYVISRSYSTFFFFTGVWQPPDVRGFCCKGCYLNMVA